MSAQNLVSVGSKSKKKRENNKKIQGKLNFLTPSLIMQLYWIHMLLLILFLMVFAACDFLTILSFPSLTSSPSQSSYHLPLPLPWTRYILTCPFSLLPCPALPTYYLFEFGKRKEKKRRKKKVPCDLVREEQGGGREREKASILTGKKKNKK